MTTRPANRHDLFQSAMRRRDVLRGLGAGAGALALAGGARGLFAPGAAA